MHPHFRAAILSTGDEIVLGQINDTNGGFIARQLVNRGIVPTEHAAVGDEPESLAAAIRRLALSHDLLIMTGGLGPTEGDLTRSALARVLGCDEVDDAEARAWLTAWFASRGRVLNERQLRQARRPALARCLRNGAGTAPGLHALALIDGHACDIYALPGPPGELTPMLREHVLPALRPPAGRRVVTRLLHAIGIGEADAVARMGDLTKRTRMPLVGITASGAVLTIRIRYEGPLDEASAQSAVGEAAAAVRAALGPCVFGEGPQTLAGAMLEALADRGESIVVVESCTGGLLGEMLTDEPGASRAFLGGWITYSNTLKQTQVGVPEKTLAVCGAVSIETASAMANGGLARSGATHALAITGIAGPDGGTADKPVGTVCIAHASAGGVDARRFMFTGGRSDVRTRAARTALAMLHFHLGGAAPGAPRLLWQVS